MSMNSANLHIPAFEMKMSSLPNLETVCETKSWLVAGLLISPATRSRGTSEGLWMDPVGLRVLMVAHASVGRVESRDSSDALWEGR